MCYHLFLDDWRTPAWVHWVALPRLPEDQWIVVDSYEAFVAAVEARGLPAFVSFDHDLDLEGERPGARTGTDCALWLAERCRATGHSFPTFQVHSQNQRAARELRERLEALTGSPDRAGRTPVRPS